MSSRAVRRFWASVDRETSDCWLWAAPLDRDGYARFYANGRRSMAHRFSYELLVGPIPVGLQLDHLCRVRHCVNPEHLEPVTAQVNVLRSSAPAAEFARRTHCPKGHEFTEANTYRRPSDDTRRCRACGAICSRRYAARKKAMAVA